MSGVLPCVVDAVSLGIISFTGNVISDHNAFMVMLPIVMKKADFPHIKESRG